MGKPKAKANWYDHRPPSGDHPWVYLFQRPDGSQILVHIYEPNDTELAERPNSEASWGPPIPGARR
jgi:hypothetical protein